MASKSSDSASSRDTADSKSGANRRRSTRLAVAVPITLSGRSATGENFREECRTVSINRHGAAIATSHVLKLGTEVVVENVPLGIAARARVVRFTRNSTSGELHQVAVELAEAKNVWGLRYPPPDWRLPPPATSRSEEVAPPPPEKVIEVDLSGPLTPGDAGPDTSANGSAPAAAPTTPLSGHEADQRLRADTAELVRLANEIEGKLEARAEEALARLGERQNDVLALEDRLSAVAKAASDASDRLESLLSRARDAGQQNQEEMEKARAGLQKASEELAKSFTEEMGRTLSQGVETVAPVLMNNLKSQAAEETAAVAERLKQEAFAALTRAKDDALSSSSQELEGLHARIVAEAEKRISLTADSAAESTLSRMREAARTFEESTFPEIAREYAARSAAEVETKQAELLKQVSAQAAAVSSDAHSKIEALRAELQQAAEGLRESALAALRQDVAAQSAQEIEKAQAGASARAKDELEIMASSVFENIRTQADRVAASAREEIISTIAGEVAARSLTEIDNKSAELLQEINAQASAATEAAQSQIKTFRADLQQAVEGLRDSTLAALSQDFAAHSAREVENARAFTSNQAKDELEVMARSMLETFRAQFEQAAASSRESAVQSVTKSASLAASEIDARRAQLLEEIHSQVSSASADVRSKIDASRTELEQATQAMRDAALSSLSQDFAARSAQEIEKARELANTQARERLELAARNTLESFQAQVEQVVASGRESAIQSVAQSASLAASEIDARRAQFLEEIHSQVSTAWADVRSKLDASRTELEQATQALRDAALSSLSQDFAARSAAEMEKAHVAANTQVKDQFESLSRGVLESFQAQLEQAAAGSREEIVSKIAGECVARSAQELDNRQSSVIKQAEEQIQAMLNARIEGFQAHLDNLSGKFEQQASRLLEQPLQVLAKHAEETVLTARGKADILRKDVVEEVRAQFGVMTRGALASMTNESKALTEEYRTQLRETFEAMKAKSSGEIKSQIQQMLEEGRETALRQVQKDAEDFGMVAVEQFRAKSAEAVREASDAVHKQVGAAAFVVKDWQDQAAQRFESYSDRLQKESEAACAALQDRSRSLSDVVLEEFKKESEALIQNLRRRIRSAADALAVEAPQEGNVPEQEKTLRPSPEQSTDQAVLTPINSPFNSKR